MLIKQAKRVACDWALREVSRLPGVHGVYLAGSVNWLPDDAVLPPTSDVDLNVVFTGRSQAIAPSKFVYDGVLLGVTSLSLEELRSPEQVLGHYHLAGGFRTPSVILDPSGHLTALQRAVSRDFARGEWVRRRCRHARSRVLQQLEALNASDPICDQVIGWLFPAGVTTHVLLVAGLRNPTVRRRYAAVRELLKNYGQLEFYEELLELLGCAGISRGRVAQHLAALTEAFDAAQATIKTPFPFACDISKAARPTAIDGSQELIDQSLHREAVFWMAVTYSRCQKVLTADAPVARQRQFEAGYRELIGDLGVASSADLQGRAEQVKALLPRVVEVAEAIIAANPEIKGES